MAQISVEQLYRGEGGGAKYGSSRIMGAVTKGILTNGVPEAYDERNWIEMLLVKHTLAAAEQMKNKGDFVPGMTDMGSPSCHEGVRDENT